MMHLDDRLIKYLQENGGKATREDIFIAFDNYSKGYLAERLRALRLSGITHSEYGVIELTKAGKTLEP